MKDRLKRLLKLRPVRVGLILGVCSLAGVTLGPEGVTAVDALFEAWLGSGAF